MDNGQLIVDNFQLSWDKVEIFRWYIINYTADRITAMKELRQLFDMSPEDAKRIIDDLPLFLIETSEPVDLLEWRDKLSDLHFVMEEEIEERWIMDNYQLSIFN